MNESVSCSLKYCDKVDNLHHQTIQQIIKGKIRNPLTSRNHGDPTVHQTDAKVHQELVFDLSKNNFFLV
jgi:hypothetical protein